MIISLNELKNIIEKTIIKEMVMYHGGHEGITKFKLYGDDIEINSRLMGTGIYLTSHLKEAESYSRGHVYTVEVPDDNGTNYLDFVKPVPEDILSKVIEKYGDIINPDELLKKGRKSLSYLLGAFRMYYSKINPDKPNHYGDELLNNVLIENGIIGHKNHSTYIIYDPNVIKILN